MNIFYLSYDPVEAARAHLDKHVVKMILEYAQLLSTAHRLIDGTQVIEKKYVNGSLPARWRNVKRWKLDDDRDQHLYVATHVNHPSNIWLRQSDSNYAWLYRMFLELMNEYTHRYGKTHASARLIPMLRYIPKNIQRGEFTPPTPAMPDECKIPGDHLASYRKYYIDKKADMAKWTNREPPQWFINGVKEKDAYVRIPLHEVREHFRKIPINRKPKTTGARTLS